MQPPEHEPGDHTNRADAERVKGNIVQARDIGGISIYGPPLPAQAQAVPHQLPGDVSNFVNREPELIALAEFLASASEEGSNAAKVIVISGSAGVGKTALALRWAHAIRSRFPAGEIYVNLRGYDDGPPQDPAVVLDRMLRALGVPGTAVPPDPEDRSAALRSILADRDILLFLDNAVSTNQVRPLLPGSARPLVVVTSRSTLPALAARDGARRIQLDILRQIGDTSREALALGCTGEVLQALGNIDDASSFHRQAALMHESVGDAWQSALALAHLADCEESRGDHAAARALGTRGLELTAPFRDMRAAALRERFRLIANGRQTNS